MDFDENLLKKMSNKELLQYLKKDNKFIYKASKYAFDILQNERGIIFSDQELADINLVLEEKKNIAQETITDKLVLDDTLENEKYSLLYSENNIIFLSAIFSPIIGAVLLYLNIKKESVVDRKKVFYILLYLIITFILILFYNLVLAKYVDIFVHELGKNSSYIRWRPYETTIKIGYKIMINFWGISFLWKKFIGKKKYRSENIFIPFIVGLLLFLCSFFIL